MKEFVLSLYGRNPLVVGFVENSTIPTQWWPVVCQKYRTLRVRHD